MTLIMVTCSNKHNFPVNTDKHRNRDVRYCPKCLSPVKKKGFFTKNFKPNQKWAEKRRIDHQPKMVEVKVHPGEYLFQAVTREIVEEEEKRVKLERKWRRKFKNEAEPDVVPRK